MMYKVNVAACSEITKTESNHHAEFLSVKHRLRKIPGNFKKLMKSRYILNPSYSTKRASMLRYTSCLWFRSFAEYKRISYLEWPEHSNCWRSLFYEKFLFRS